MKSLEDSLSARLVFVMLFLSSSLFIIMPSLADNELLTNQRKAHREVTTVSSSHLKRPVLSSFFMAWADQCWWKSEVAL